MLVVFFDGGMRGVAIASSLGAVAGILSIVPYLSKPPKPFTFHIPGLAESLRLLNKCMYRGLPNVVESVAMIVLFLTMNVITLNTQGADGMFILSVCLQTLSLSFLVTDGVGSAIEGWPC